jgi:SAM-dependent methyltransferase
MDAQALRELLVCPRCRGRLEDRAGALACRDAECALSSRPFLRAGGRHVLIDHERSVLSRERFAERDGASEKDRGRATRSTGARRFARELLDGTYEPGRDCARRMAAELVATRVPGTRPRVLVVGGGRISDGPEILHDHPDLDVVAFDIYASPLVDFIADAHQIPFADASLDAVWIQAVLEHVLEPHVVAAEIARVLKVGGIVFADAPFLQQVHEGPYDFVRFTETGLRWLLKDFECILSGTSAGLATQWLWSLEYALAGLTRSRAVGRAARRAMFWLRAFDRVIPEAHHVDGASGFYFLGRRVATPLTPADILEHYRGAQRPRPDHVAAGRVTTPDSRRP